MRDLIFINSHPIQYFAPLYKFLSKKGIKTKVWYCTDTQERAKHDKEFGVNIEWDIPILEGYAYKSFKNYSWKKSQDNGFFGLINLGMIKELFKIDKSILIVHGYHYFTHLLILVLGNLAGHKVCLRHDVPYSHEKFKNGIKHYFRHLVLKFAVFPRINYFLYIGIENKALYENYGIDERKLLFCPYAVDNERFLGDFIRLLPAKADIKTRLGIPKHNKIILYSGKFINKKRPLDLVRAFYNLPRNDCSLILMGEGILRKEIESVLQEENKRQVILTGFQNQSQISEYYLISDLFVMCSSLEENWGLSVNEAMNFNLPIILSDMTGCSKDLVEPGINGFIFQTGNVDDLTQKITDILYNEKLTRTISSREIVSEYSFEIILKQLEVLRANVK